MIKDYKLKINEKNKYNQLWAIAGFNDPILPRIKRKL